MRVYILLLFFINTVSGCTTDDDCSGDVCLSSVCTAVSSLPEWSCASATPENTGNFKISGDCTMTVREVVVSDHLKLYGVGNPTITAKTSTTKRRHFNVGASKTLTLNGLKLTGGYESDGGSIWAYGNHANVYIYSCVLFSNVAMSKGGAVYMYNGKLGVYDTTITDNLAGHQGNSGMGGGIWHTASGGDYWFELHDSIISANNATGRGGGIYKEGDYSYTNDITRSTISNNRILDRGTIEISGIIYDRAHYRDGGGGMFIMSNSLTTVTIRESTFDKNYDILGKGHQIHVYASSGVGAKVLAVNTNFISCPDCTTGEDFYLWEPGWGNAQRNNLGLVGYLASNQQQCAAGFPCTEAPYTGACTDVAQGMTCASTVCAENEYVSSNVCTACPVGMGNVAGDDATGVDTTCVYQCPVSAPANGALGDCVSPLADGATCVPTCNEGYMLSGINSCTTGTLTAAECIPYPSYPSDCLSGQVCGSRVCGTPANAIKCGWSGCDCNSVDPDCQRLKAAAAAAAANNVCIEDCDQATYDANPYGKREYCPCFPNFDITGLNYIKVKVNGASTYNSHANYATIAKVKTTYTNFQSEYNTGKAHPVSIDNVDASSGSFIFPIDCTKTEMEEFCLSTMNSCKVFEQSDEDFAVLHHELLKSDDSHINSEILNDDGSGEVWWTAAEASTVYTNLLGLDENLDPLDPTVAWAPDDDDFMEDFDIPYDALVAAGTNTAADLATWQGGADAFDAGTLFECICTSAGVCL